MIGKPGITNNLSNSEFMLRNERFSLLSDIASLLLLSDDPHVILDNVFRMMSAHLGLEAYFNYLVTDDGSRMRLFEYGGISADMAKEIEWLEYGQAVCGCVARDRARIIAEDVQCTSDTRTDLIRSLGITAYCCHPLIAHGNLIGTLSFGTRGRTKFSDDDIELMQTVCKLVATSLDRAKLISNLHDSRIKLDEKVKERTLELQEKQKELEVQAKELDAQNRALFNSNKALRKAEETSSRLALIVESSDDAIVGKTLDGFITSWNAGAEKMFGYSAIEVLGKNISILVPSGYYDEIPDLLSRIRNGGIVKHYETVRMRKDGTLIDISLSVSPIKDRSGKLIGISSIKRDITERKHAEEILHKKEEILEHVIDSSPIPLVLHDETEKILSVNKKFTETFGYTIKDIPGISEWWTNAYPDEKYREFVKKRWYTAIDHAIKNKVSIPPREVEVACKDGSKRHILSEFSSIGDINLSVLYDITDRKKAEEELKEAKLQAELYLDLMGHDISNMHQIAMGQLELANEFMNDEGRLNLEEKELIETPLATLNRSARLIENVRNLQKTRRGEFKVETIDINDLLYNLVKEYDPVVPDNSIKFVGNGPSNVIANNLLHDVFSNIIGNAIKHSNGNGIRINIKLENADEDGKNYHKVSIEDNGPGIPEDMKDRIFNRLQRGETNARGMGLGLYLVKSLVDSYHGQVWVEDRVTGDHTKGSKFVVLLPASGNSDCN